MSAVISNRKVAVLGAAAIDWIARVSEFPPIDGISFVEQYQAFTGGSGGNVTEGLGRLGYDVSFLGSLGDDEGGQMLLRAFHQAGVNTSGTQIVKDERSAACFIAVDENGQRVIFALGGVALLETPEEVCASCLEYSDLLYIADAFPEVALAAVDYLPDEARVVFSPGGLMASAGFEYLRPILEQTDILILNQVEVKSLTNQEDIEQACTELLYHGPKVIFLTLGEKGVRVVQKDSCITIPAEVVPEVVDTTGAGDAFSTGVVAGMLEGSGWEDCARLGCKMAANKIGHMGSRAGLPDRKFIMTWQETRTRKAR